MKSFTEITYEEMVNVLCKDGNDILQSLTPEKCDLWHVASCIPGEIAELFDAIRKGDAENALEELGDLEFYLTKYTYIVFGKFLTNLSPVGYNYNTVGNLVLSGGNLFDLVKKHVIYGSDLDTVEIQKEILNIRNLLRDVRDYFGFSLDDVRNANKRKLEARYHNLEYADQQARERRDKEPVVQEEPELVLASPEYIEPAPVPVAQPVVRRPKRTVEYPTTLW